METLTTLAARYGAPELEVHRLGQPVNAASYAGLILKYLGTFGPPPATVTDLEAELDALEDEDDLEWWAVPEGLVVSSATDGWWVLFKEPGHE